MTTGATILAFNNGTIDYVALAAWSARRIKRWLKIPVCIITDSVDVDPIFDHVVNTEALGDRCRFFEDIGATVPWHNANRADAYELTPWNRTLLLDADYVVSSAALQTMLQAPCDFMCHRYATDVMTGRRLDALNWFGRYRFPQWWATVMVFQKSQQASYIFEIMQMVRDHWEHYRMLYAIANPTYRNDHALSIALGLESGHTLVTYDIPWNLQSVMPDVWLEQEDDDLFMARCMSQGSQSRLHIHGTDFHAMGKAQLGAIVAAH